MRLGSRSTDARSGQVEQDAKAPRGCRRTRPMLLDPGRVVGRGRMRLPTQDRVRRREFWELLVVNWQLSSSVMIDACPRESPGICGIFSTMPLVGWVQCSEPHRPSAERWGDKRRTALSDVRRGEEEAVRTIGGLRSRGSRVREPYRAQGLLALLWWCRHGTKDPVFSHGFPLEVLAG